jgi:hypothetical protein
MRKPDRLSHSALSLWEARPEEHYLRYLSERRPPRIPQDRPAAAGSAFDAYAKAYLYSALFGAADPKYTFEALFEAQVEAHNRDWALAEGQYVFDCYRVSGFLAKLLDELKKASEPPRFEFTVEAVINGVPFLGKPDAKWITPYGIHVVHDWKLNGFCSRSAVSPHKSYQLSRDGWVGKQSKSHDTAHKEYLDTLHCDMLVNTSYMEVSNAKWADQLSLYGWAMGEQIGDEDVVLSIHQITAKPIPESRPQLRVSQYRARVASEYQHQLVTRLKKCWDAIQSGHIFPNLSKEDSDARCAVLDEAAIGLLSDGSSREEFFNECTRQGYRG